MDYVQYIQLHTTMKSEKKMNSTYKSNCDWGKIKIHREYNCHTSRNSNLTANKANLRDLIAATGLVISNWIQIVNFSAGVTVKFDGWPCKTIGHLFYATSSFVHHFVAIGEFKLELQSGNAQSGSNSTIFRAVRPWNLTHDLENNRVPLLPYFKLCASFRSHRWIQTWVTVRKHPIWVKFDDF